MCTFNPFAQLLLKSQILHGKLSSASLSFDLTVRSSTSSTSSVSSVSQVLLASATGRASLDIVADEEVSAAARAV